MNIANNYAQALGDLSGGRILDVATGGGGFVQVLIEHLKDWEEITAIDTSEKSARAFQETFQDPKVRFRHMDACRLAFDNQSFDTVCISNSLHHLAGLPGVLAEMKRVLRPGGRLIVREMYCDGQSETQLTHVLLHHWWAAIDTASGILHHETFTRRQLVDLLEGCDLHELALYDIADLEADPKDPQLVEELEGIIDLYLQRVEGLPGEAALRGRGEEIRQRCRLVGFHSATHLLAIGTARL